jgi:CheY-like chemotaxis protein
VLLDIDLPDLDGYTLAVLLRHRGLPHARMVAVSSHEDDPTKRRAASIDAHYMKPEALRRIGEILATQ